MLGDEWVQPVCQSVPPPGPQQAWLLFPGLQEQGLLGEQLRIQKSGPWVQLGDLERERERERERETEKESRRERKSVRERERERDRTIARERECEYKRER